MPEFNNTTTYAIGGFILCVGLLLVMQAKIKNGQAILEVEPGQDPELVFRTWKADKWHKKVSRGALILITFAIVGTVAALVVAAVGYFWL